MSVPVLFVCKANVCRSPSAAALFRSALRDANVDELITADSAGTDAQQGQPWCRDALRRVGRGRTDEMGLTKRGSRRLDEGLLEQAIMVLAADRATSTEVIRMNPGVRSRLFTIVEAAALADVVQMRVNSASDSAVLSDLVTVRPRPQTESVWDRLVWLITEMNAVRGQAPVQPAPRLRRWRRHRVNGWSNSYDVPDAHSGGDSASHSRMFNTLAVPVKTVADAVIYAVS